MPRKAAIITIHGMGDTTESYANEFFDEMESRLGIERFDNLYIGSVYYQGILQANETRVWNRVSRRLKWDALRKFLLYGFADAAGLENGKESVTSVYARAQTILAKELLNAHKSVGSNGPVIILAHSLGCQVASCYFWDAAQFGQPGKPTVGIWQDREALERAINDGKPLTDDEIAFLQGKTSLGVLYTTGCNIPIFVAAHSSLEILPIRPNENFEWHNFYDKDDVLGWPLRELSDQYAEVVEDHSINAGGGIMGWLLKSWNPMSHGQYWGDDEVLDPIEKKLKEYLDR